MEFDGKATTKAFGVYVFLDQEMLKDLIMKSTDIMFELEHKKITDKCMSSGFDSNKLSLFK